VLAVSLPLQALAVEVPWDLLLVVAQSLLLQASEVEVPWALLQVLAQSLLLQALEVEVPWDQALQTLLLLTAEVEVLWARLRRLRLAFGPALAEVDLLVPSHKMRLALLQVLWVVGPLLVPVVRKAAAPVQVPGVPCPPKRVQLLASNHPADLQHQRRSHPAMQTPELSQITTSQLPLPARHFHSTLLSKLL